MDSTTPALTHKSSARMQPLLNASFSLNWAIAGTLILLLVLITSVVLYLNYRNRLEAAEGRVMTASQDYAAAVELMMGSIENVLTSTDRLYHSTQDDENLMHDYLVRSVDTLPMIRLMTIIDADGQIIMDSREDEPGVGVDVSDRMYVRVHLRGGAAGLFVDEPIESRVDGEWLIPVSMGMTGAAGDVGGVIMAGLDPRYFDREFTGMSASITHLLIIQRGMVLTTIPYTDDLVGADFSSNRRLLAAIGDNSVDTFTADLFNEGSNHMVAVRQAGSFPLIVVSALDQREVVTPFLQTLAVAIGVLSLAVIGIVGITRYQMQRTRDFYAQATALEQAVRERGEAEKMALDQEKQLRAIVENTPDLIARFDREFRHLYVNPALRGSTGEAYTDYIGKRGEELDIAPETVTRWNTMLSEVFESGEPKVYEFEIETSTGTQHLESVIAPEIVEGEIQTVISITRDITPRKLLEAERLYAAKLEADLEAQRELNALKNRFNSMVSHEFRNPLSIIQLSGNILERYRDRLDPDRMNEHIRKINGQVERMASMLEDMLFLGRDEAGRTRFQPDELDIGTFCEGLVKRFRQHDHGKHNLVFDAGNVTPTVSADTELLTHIFNNLLENALKYSPAGTTVTFRLRQEDDSLIAEIADEGIGIPEEDQARIFDAFHRGDNVREVGGTGLGLAVVQRSVDAHGGSVRFTSVEGEGTTFTVYLPIVI